MIEKYGICHLGMIPMRVQPLHESEMVSQLIFGELFVVLEELDNWVKIAVIFDGYQGWITQSVYEAIDKDEFKKLDEAPYWVVCEPFQKIKNVNTSEIFYIPGGSVIFNFKEDDLTFNILNNWYQFIEKPKLNNTRKAGNIPKIAFSFAHTPYLWGGRTAMGIDCSGFSQIVYKILNISIPRDASQQVDKGNTVSFLAESREGDLAFFDNEDGKIIHVGILLSNAEIIHSSGFVRIDAIDQTGIYNRTLRNYSHKLRIIKRIIF